MFISKEDWQALQDRLFKAESERDESLAVQHRLEVALFDSVTKADMLEQGYEGLLKVITGSLTICAETNLELKHAVQAMQGVVAEMSRPKVVLYQGGMHQTC